MATFEVLSAVYGALHNGDKDDARAINVRETLSTLLKEGTTTVKISNDTFGDDPSSGDGKHFAAIVRRDGDARYFACKEDQTIDFTKGG